ncbi:hypothetical protein Tco_1176421 [Tanacetum coccineum]
MVSIGVIATNPGEEVGIRCGRVTTVLVGMDRKEPGANCPYLTHKIIWYEACGAKFLRFKSLVGLQNRVWWRCNMSWCQRLLRDDDEVMCTLARHGFGWILWWLSALQHESSL